VPFDRDKLAKSFQIALRKRPVDPERIDRAVSGIVRRLESSGETEIATDEIGLLVLEALKALDDVGFVRYASVYRDFSGPQDFERTIAELTARIANDSRRRRSDAMPVKALDRRYMAAAIRLARWHEGRTGSNPSVATLIVREIDGAPVIVGRGVTAIGGRPHAEPQALAEAGDLARGATAYVTLEPCAHHGRTPPCAEALVAAGVTRVVAAATDPDERVSGTRLCDPACCRYRGRGGRAGARGGARSGRLSDPACTKNRAHVTLKLAVSANGKIGRRDGRQVVISGEIARQQVHALRARSDVILIGVGTAINDDPELTCRLARSCGPVSDPARARYAAQAAGHLPACGNGA
jgi:pyrimidine deaminase RibD-like protein